jgi:formylglycine-generating enzyme required for sulfatase activity
MVLVEGGTFRMGSNNGYDEEKPVHTETVKGFYIGKYEVTQNEWKEIMGTTVAQQVDMAFDEWINSALREGSNESYFSLMNQGREIFLLAGEGNNYPMYYVSWYEAAEYCNKLSMKERLVPAYRGLGDDIVCDFSATGYRLPTEAEWEYAAKGGNKDYISYEYSGGNNVDNVAWYSGNSGGWTYPVGTKQANSLGLYDMSGNVWEWCWDWYEDYTSEVQTNPAGASSGPDRVLRGGGWLNSDADVRSASRSSYTPSNRYGSIGFRLVRP